MGLMDFGFWTEFVAFALESVLAPSVASRVVEQTCLACEYDT